jgi:phosphoribosylamine---glycine ligase
MNILLIGSGAREHAMARHISQSPLCSKLWIAPGNAGTEEWNLKLNTSHHPDVLAFCKNHAVDLVIVGPEQPLTSGLADELRAHHIPVTGPGSSGARLEGSKAFSKAFMEKHGIPTATCKVFQRSQYAEALAYIQQHSLPVVLKADGLAAGKGVTVASSMLEAENALNDIFIHDRFGNAGDTLVIESFLQGLELSVFILTDGKNYILLPEAMDYKRVGEGNSGPNTGGMGAISPLPFFTEALKDNIIQTIIEPTLKGLQKEGISYRGFIFFGLMADGAIASVIEYNVRMGDPETEVVFPRIAEDLLPHMYAAAKGALQSVPLQVSPMHAQTTVCVSGGYPDRFETGKEITLPSEVPADVSIFHAGTRMEHNRLLTSGGRVLAVTALAEDPNTAAEISRHWAETIRFDGKYFRRDIGVI